MEPGHKMVEHIIHAPKDGLIGHQRHQPLCSDVPEKGNIHSIAWDTKTFYQIGLMIGFELLPHTMLCKRCSKLRNFPSFGDGNRKEGP